MKKFIDIRRILKEKNPKLEKWIPGFIVGYLKKIFHQDEINTILDENKDLEVREFCDDLQKRFGITYLSKGLENVPTSGGAIFVANHPLGGLDALAVVQIMAPIRKDFKFVVNDVMMNIKNIESLMIGVNKHGVKSKESIQLVNDVFQSEQAIFFFPAGLVSRKPKGEVTDSEWKKTFISRAKKFKKDIIPIHIDGELSSFFYRLSNTRRKLGVKANIEMLYLANETFKLKNKEITVTVGKPISYTTFDKSKSDKEWADVVKEIVYELKE